MTSRKPYIVLALIFVFQLTVSCFCDCPGPKTYEVVYNDVSVVGHDTSGFGSEEVLADSVYKNAFGLTVSVNFDLNKISASDHRPFSLFNSAFACDCVGDEHRFSDPIDYVAIYAIDTETQDRTEVTDYFSTYGYDNSGLISLDELFENRAEWHDGFQFELVDFDSIPNTAIFVAEAYLESGNMFIDSTTQVNFYH